jgi:hypothetical protein
VETAKVSDAESPLASEAVSLMLSPLVSAGTVPLKVRVVALNLRQIAIKEPMVTIRNP